MHITYIPEDINYWIEFYKSSINNNQHYQLGGILPGFRAYAQYHRGNGIGSIFKSLYRFMLPMLQTVGKQALITGSKVAADVASGHNVKTSLEEHGRDAASTLLNKAADDIKQRGHGLGKRKRHSQNYKKHHILKKTSVLKRKSPKIVGSDIFSRN